MQALSAGSLLDVWEKGRTQHPIDRGLLLFSLADPDAEPNLLADEPVGRRNEAILRMRLATFGTALRAFLDCPACDGRLELELDGRALLATAPEPETSVQVDGLSFRLPTSRDLAALDRDASPEESALRLLRLCWAAGEGSLDEARAERLLAPVEAAMEAADPMAEVVLDVRCPSCGHAWSAPFDVIAFLWEEIDAYAQRLLDEIHVLASAYGWNEAEILSLPGPRRAAYIERIRT